MLYLHIRPAARVVPAYLFALIPYLLHVPLVALLAYGLYRKYRGSPLRRYFFPALAMKLAAGVVLGLLYTYHYTYGGDTFLFHREATAGGRSAVDTRLIQTRARAE